MASLLGDLLGLCGLGLDIGVSPQGGQSSNKQIDNKSVFHPRQTAHPAAPFLHFHNQDKHWSKQPKLERQTNPSAAIGPLW